MCSLLYVSTTSIKVVFFFFLNQCFPISHQIKPDFSAWYSSSLRVWHQLPFLVLRIKTLFSISHAPVKQPSLSRPLPTALFSIAFSQALQTSSRPSSNVPSSVKTIQIRDFPGGPVAKTPHSQSRGPGFDLWSGN